MRIRVSGRAPLQGTYHPSGSANAAQALIAAALLTEQPVTLHNIPDTEAVSALIEVAESYGAELTKQKNTLVITAPQLKGRTITHGENNQSLGVILLVAPLLVRRQFVRLETDLPLNRIRTHLEAMRDLGIDVVNNNGSIEMRGIAWDEKEVLLTQQSVTATALIILLASRLGKKTTLHNAASEPHIQDLCSLLQQMGVKIEGFGSNLLVIHGTDDLQSAEFTIRPDHIEIASIAVITAMTGGRVQIEGIRRHDLQMATKVFRGLGIQFDVDEQTLYIPHHGQLLVSNREEDVDASIETTPWPGFPSDLIALATVTATQARGTSLIHEKLFNNRLLFVDKLKAMGAQIVLADPHRAIVIGATPLRGIYMDSPDIRTGLGMLSAAMVAHGDSVIDNAQSLDYTFGGIINKLVALNAQIKYE